MRATRLPEPTRAQQLRKMFQTQKLSKRFPTQTLFEDIDIVVADGERVGLVGPNGAGKTTLLRMLAGDEPPSEGRAGHSGGALGFLTDSKQSSISESQPSTLESGSACLKRSINSLARLVSLRWIAYSDRCTNGGVNVGS